MKSTVRTYTYNDDDEVWEEIPSQEYCCERCSPRPENTISVIEFENGAISYDFSGCEEVDAGCLNSFFETVGAIMGQANYKWQASAPSLFVQN